MRDVIERGLRDVAGPTPDVIVLHSSLIHLGLPPRRLRWDLLGALNALVDAGATVAVPTFTFSFCAGQPFDLRRSRSETGVVGDWLRESTLGRRTPHPIYSFAVIGPRAPELAACVNTTTFGDDSVFALFERLDARIVMLGADWSYCTQLHRYEEEAAVPYRHYKDFRGMADLGAGPMPTDARMFVRDREIDARNDFSAVIERARAAGRIASHPLGAGQVEAISTSAIASIARDLLQSDPYALVSEPAVVAHKVRQATARRESPALRLAVVGDSNLDLAREAIHAEVARHVGDRQVEAFPLPYGQWRQQVLNSSSDLCTFRAEIAFVINRPEDVLRVATLDAPLDETRAIGEVDAYADFIGKLATTVSRHVFVLGLNLGGPSSAAPLHGAEPTAADALAAADQRLRERLAEWPHISVVAPASIPAEGPVSDPRLWLLGRVPFSSSFTQALARRCAGLVLASLERTVRLLIVDVDNTLWGGVLGEDGADGVTIGGDYPGNAYAAFQRELLMLRRRGVALAICSKNDEADLLHAIRARTDMLIREDDLAAWRINWDPKWINVKEIAEELNVGLANVGFIDDNPLECELVRANLPDVHVLALPADPAEFAAALREWPSAAAVAVTGEDRGRAARYTTSRRARAERAGFSSPTAYLMSLDSRLQIAKLGPDNIARCVQLLNRTNQFNATTRRYGMQDLQAMDASGDMIAVLGLADRHSELENIGVLVVRWNHPREGVASIDTLLLSCRVLGRGLETAALAWAADEARRRGMRSVIGTIVPTDRNAPVRDVYRAHGFAPGDAEGEWRLSLDAASQLRVPAWVTVVDTIAHEMPA